MIPLKKYVIKSTTLHSNKVQIQNYCEKHKKKKFKLITATVIREKFPIKFVHPQCDRIYIAHKIYREKFKPSY